MSFYYYLFPFSDNINEVPKTGFRARAVSRGTLGIEYIAERLAQRTTFNEGEIEGIIKMLALEVEFILGNGFNASLGDLGTFSISAGSRVIENEDDIRSGSIELRKVNHRQSAKMLKRLRSVAFERLPEQYRYTKGKTRMP